MRLTRRVALFVAVMTLAPWAYLLLAAYLVPHLIASKTGGLTFDQFIHTALFRIEMAAILLNILVLVAFYVLYLFRTDHVQGNRKALWAVMLCLGSLLAMPVFWYLYMWPREPGAA